MPSSADLDRTRWDWSTEAVTRLRAELRGIEDSAEGTDLAHVMVVGDTQVGKTTLLLRLLGVTDPGAAKDAADALAGGRGRAESKTAVPIRYQWSGDPECWSLVHGPDRQTAWLDSDRIEERMAGFRHGTGLTWDPAARPIEIGLPDRLAGPAQRHDLRVFDLPGLYADTVQEQEVARTLIATYAPVMNFVVLVLSGDQFAEQLEDPTINDNPFLATWGTEPDRFHLVFTRAFSNAKVREYLEDRFDQAPPESWSADEVLTFVRDHYDDELRDSGLPAGRRETLFPVEIGDTWHELVGTTANAAYAAAVSGTNDRLLADLGRTIVGFSDADSAHLAAPEIARRVAVLVRANRRRRQTGIDAASAELSAAEAARAAAEQLVIRTDERLAQAEARADGIRLALAELATLPIDYRRPGAPEMDGTQVRGKQEQERVAWIRVARAGWDAWRRRQPADAKFPALPPPDLDARLRAEYDRCVNCCRLCEKSWWSRSFFGGDVPEECYRRMSTVDLRQCIRATLSGHAQPALPPAEKQAVAARRQAGRAQVELRRCDVEEAAARTTLEQVITRAGPAEAEDRRNLEVADTVRVRLEETNREYARGLVSRARRARGDQRRLLFLAALRAVHDLDRMFKR